MGENVRTGRLGKGLGPVASRVSNEQGPDHEDVDVDEVEVQVKGVVPQFVVYCSNLIFWKGMGCGIAHFGQILEVPPRRYSRFLVALPFEVPGDKI